ncbi:MULTISPECIES: type II 3-dehydroquinate dehydratase [Pseudomonas aeruginosa group]|uniref:type II 3-dehydroquinate dehydratase n=1 Tax=Pseudomonas aeruginosa group TaxID=136841 RepID=UPI001A24BFD3|nr:MULTISPECIES: type II 3-dehydroquinate dehydratase [Pseudomonas aeruginosa group]MBG6886133.1 3-dehydroquinate dehydratase [Pseudomonas aeruginosa]MCY0315497.1 3-dehydroquinate dehydratase [Pseudomonas aeruginosa]MCY0517482.1 3-dehydroquinate dehydratase [Pseudomonas aeruginosa]MDI3610673.1 type II 3-dehydroquinate dehydratase [Pseudomonas aeruginosa]MDI3677544.1 type II 3-dehydroquinate dehydratase [Pseudomonas aeruginosa]
MPTLLLLNGPNLGRLGLRKPQVYGHRTLADITDEVTTVAAAHGWTVRALQSNHEGELIDFIEANHTAEAMVINPGALMMAGWALRDALEDYPGRWMEVHISNLFGREAFRHASVTAPLCHGFIAGMGTDAYAAAAALLIEKYHG